MTKIWSFVGLIFIGIALPVMMQGQACTLSISGKVLNAKTGEPMAFANVAIKGINIGAVADENGLYKIENLCKGDYVLVCTRIGCDHLEHTIHLQNNIIKDFQLVEESIQLENVLVHGEAIKLQNTQATSELSGAALSSTQGLPLSESLKKLPGVSTLNTGASIAKPVIQGLHSTRILILNNGVRQEGQQWGSEHAPEIDPFIADKVNVIKGASGVRYGADAIGGVILITPRALPVQKGIGGEFNLQGFSNGQMGVASGMLQGNLGGKLPLSGRIQGTLKKSGNLQTPNYFLENTGVQEYNFSWATGLKRDKFDVETFYSRFYTKLGIFRGSHIGNLTDLQNAIERERPLDDGSFSYEIGRPQQRISHELFKLSSSLQTGDIGKLNFQYARQFNRRQEFDAHKQFNELSEEITIPSIEFELTTHTADLTWEHKPFLNLRGDIGLDFMYQKNTTDRGALIPNYDSYNASAFWIERWKNYPFPLELEAGIRYDYRWMSVGQQGRDTIGLDLNFSNVSGTFGAIYKFPKLVILRLNIGSAWRAPNVSELYSDGVHHGSASYEKGDPSLKPERAVNTSLTAELDNKKNFTVSINIYYNNIQDFIYLNPREQPQLTIRGAFPAFDYRQADARIMGLDWGLDYEFIPNWAIESRISLLRSWNRTLDDYLVFMPADRFQHGLKYNFNNKDTEKEAPFIRFTMTNVLKQTRVPKNTDYAPAPPGYTRFDLEVGTTFYLKKQPIEAGLSILNVFDESYREYLNRFRYFSDELGRNISLRIKIPFGVK
ncbi:MAG: TonB-dependent receptor [Saprospiraceae bacterium]|nr:TonB-dependent receptor [Saprospiraceae bacterium]